MVFFFIIYKYVNPFVMISCVAYKLCIYAVLCSIECGKNKRLVNLSDEPACFCVKI